MIDLDQDRKMNLAYGVRQWLDRPEFGVDPDVLTASMNGTLHKELARVFPDLVPTFGVAVAHAAMKNMGLGTCRFCLADAYARAHNEPRPNFDDATMLILGNPCRVCLGKHVHETSASSVVGGRGDGDRWAGGRGGGGRGSSSSSSATPRAPFHDPRRDPCTTCAAARSAASAARRRGLTASAVRTNKDINLLITKARLPHAPKLAGGPVGRLRYDQRTGTMRPKRSITAGASTAPFHGKSTMTEKEFDDLCNQLEDQGYTSLKDLNEELASRGLIERRPNGSWGFTNAVTPTPPKPRRW